MPKVSEIVNPADAEVPNADAEVEQAKSVLVKMADLEALVQTALKNAPKPPAEETAGPPPGTRVFVAPAYPNMRVLVKQGKLIQAPSPDGPRDIRREGDVWAKFVGGILVTDDPDVIAWCEAHHDVCRDAYDPKTEVWVALVQAQRETATSEAKLPPGLDVEKLLEGDIAGLGGLTDLVKNARSAAEVR
jgi:hypothetical protein